MTTAREKLASAGIPDESVRGHMAAGRLFAGAVRVTDLDAELPAGATVTVGHGPEHDVDQAAVEAELAAFREARAAKAAPSNFPAP